MYPEWELRRLAAHKAALRRDIVVRRVQCAEAAARVAQPFVWLDRWRAICRQLLPVAQLAAVPLGVLVMRAVFFRLNKISGSLMRWAPLVFGVVRVIRSSVKGRSRTTPQVREPVRRRR